MTGAAVRVTTQDGEPWFVAKDVCDALGFSDANAGTRHLDDDEKMTVKLTAISKTNPMATLINESGLYSLILKSRKPEAKAFKKWVTRDVLPAIRKDGGYVLGEERVKTGEMSEDELMARALIMIPTYDRSCASHLGRSLACGTGRSPQQVMKLTFEKIIPGDGI